MLHHDSMFRKTVKKLTRYGFENTADLINCMTDAHENNPYAANKESIQYLSWEEQCSLNFPLLYLASIYLYVYAKRLGCKVFLFTTRDCCQWVKIFKKMFPNEIAHYFNCSRIMFETATQNHNRAYKKYVKSLVGDDVQHTIYVDIHGTGKRLFNYFEKEFDASPYCFILSVTDKKESTLPSVTKGYIADGKFMNLMFDTRGSPIEMLNYDLIGTLKSYEKEAGPIRAKPEYDIKLIKPYHDCIDYMTNKIAPVQIENIFAYNLGLIYKLIKKIFKIINNKKPIVSMYIKHESVHKKTDTTTYNGKR